MDEVPKQVEGVLYRFKQQSEKTFLTPFGKMKLSRNLFQADEGGSSYVPLDVMWGMVGEFATVEVREAVLFAVSLSRQRKRSMCWKRQLCISLLPQRSNTSQKRRAPGWETMDETLNQSIRQKEETPEGTKVMVASLDGTNLRLKGRGKNAGVHLSACVRLHAQAGKRGRGKNPPKKARLISNRPWWAACPFMGHLQRTAPHQSAWSLGMWHKCPKRVAKR